MYGRLVEHQYVVDRISPRPVLIGVKESCSEEEDEELGETTFSAHQMCYLTEFCEIAMVGFCVCVAVEVDP